MTIMTISVNENSASLIVKQNHESQIHV